MSDDKSLPIHSKSEILRSWRDFRDAVCASLNIADDFYTHKDWKAAVCDTRETVRNYSHVAVKVCRDEFGVPCDIGWDIGKRKDNDVGHIGLCLPPGFKRF